MKSLLRSLSNSSYKPFPADEVIPQLYVGGIETVTEHQKQFKSKNITHVVSIIEDSWGLKVSKEVKHLQLNIKDHVAEDIIQYFDSTFDFIEASLQSNGAVLVHCQAGISRSGSFTIAYVMKKRRISFEDAFVLVTKVRQIIRPNPMFAMQLRVYEKMNYSFDPQSANYYRIKACIRTLDMAEKWNIATISGAIPWKNENYIEELSDGVFKQTNTAFHCKNCKNLLFSEQNIIGKFAFLYQADLTSSNRRDSPNVLPDSAYYFIEPMKWIPNIKANDDTMKCYQCATIIGIWQWKKGRDWNPSFKVQRDKVEEVNSIASNTTTIL